MVISFWVNDKRGEGAGGAGVGSVALGVDEGLLEGDDVGDCVGEGVGGSVGGGVGDGVGANVVTVSVTVLAMVLVDFREGHHLRGRRGSFDGCGGLVSALVIL